MRSRLDRNRCRIVAESLGLSESEVSRIVSSFFGTIAGYARTLPFNNPQRIYSADKFSEYVRAWNIPYVGRLGLSYSRYLDWRSNEAELSEQMHKSAFLKKKSRDEIEAIAETVLSGGAYFPPTKKQKMKYNRVWIVGKDGKKLARQVLPKTEKDVQD